MIKQMLITLLMMCSLWACSNDSSEKASLWTISGGESWCSSSHSIGSGDNYINILVENNDTGDSRSATFTVVASGAESLAITVTQNSFGIEPYEEYIAPDKTGMRDMKSIDFVKLMNVGWNLGNSMEAISKDEDGNLSGDETTWGNPRITKEFVTTVKNAGFNTIRIPVAWSHQFENKETYKIKQSWMKRVEEVVNYALDNDMFVMINIHWDGGWLGHPFEKYKDELNKRQEIMWKQIALHFRNYDDRLMFAGSNEVTNEEDPMGKPTPENYNVQNSFNQTFVNAVRATGGRNAYRHLIVQAYNTNTEYAIEGLEMPLDNIKNRLSAEMHYYTPFPFTLKEKDFDALWGMPYIGGDGSGYRQEDDVNKEFAKIKKHFIDKDIPVIIGEYGALIRANLPPAEYGEHLKSLQYYLGYVTGKSKEYGLTPVYWDNGVIDYSGFALFDRKTGILEHPEIITEMINSTK